MAERSEKIKEKIKIFEKAIIPEITKLKPPKIKKIFLAIDSHAEASEVSENALQITITIAKRFQSEVYIACIAPTAEELRISERKVDKATKLFKTENISVLHACMHGRPSERLLELFREYKPSLIVMPIPYGERAENFEIESLGATIELVLRKSPFPILLVRKPKFKPSRLTEYVVLFIDKMENTKAAELALSLLERGSTLEILSVTEKETAEKVENLTEALTESEIKEGTLESLHKKEIQSLISGITEIAKTRGIIIERTHLLSNKIKAILEEAEDKHTLIVVHAIITHGKIIGSEVENLARFSKIPILIVKT